MSDFSPHGNPPGYDAQGNPTGPVNAPSPGFQAQPSQANGAAYGSAYGYAGTPSAYPPGQDASFAQGYPPAPPPYPAGQGPYGGYSAPPPAPGYPNQYYMPPVYQPQYVAAPSRGKSVASLVLGLISILTCWYFMISGFSLLTSILGIVLGVMGRKDDPMRPSGLATAGLVLSIIAAAVSGLFLLFCIALLS